MAINASKDMKFVSEITANYNKCSFAYYRQQRLHQLSDLRVKLLFRILANLKYFQATLINNLQKIVDNERNIKRVY